MEKFIVFILFILILSIPFFLIKPIDKIVLNKTEWECIEERSKISLININQKLTPVKTYECIIYKRK